MAFQMNFTGTSPVRSSTPLHQNVSTNESFSLNENKERVRRLVTTTPDQIIPGTDAPPPVVTTTPGKTKKYTGMDNMCSQEYKAVYGSKKCDDYNSRPPKPPIVVPPTETIVSGEGTPPQIIPGSENVETRSMKEYDIRHVSNTSKKCQGKLFGFKIFFNTLRWLH